MTDLMSIINWIYPLILSIVTVVGFFWKIKLSQQEIENKNETQDKEIERLELQITKNEDNFNKFLNSFSKYKDEVGNKFSKGTENFARIDGKLESLNQKLDILISLTKERKEQ